MEHPPSVGHSEGETTMDFHSVFLVKQSSRGQSSCKVLASGTECLGSMGSTQLIQHLQSPG